MQLTTQQIWPGHQVNGVKITKSFAQNIIDNNDDDDDDCYFIQNKRLKKKTANTKKWQAFRSGEQSHFAKAIVRQKGQFGAELQNKPTTKLELLYANYALKNTKYLKNDSNFKVEKIISLQKL